MIITGSMLKSYAAIIFCSASEKLYGYIVSVAPQRFDRIVQCRSKAFSNDSTQQKDWDMAWMETRCVLFIVASCIVQHHLASKVTRLQFSQTISFLVYPRGKGRQ